MKKFIICVYIMSILISIFSIKNHYIVANLQPDFQPEIIANNEAINYFDIINKLKNNVSDDSLNYAFNHDKITEDLINFKSKLIDIINNHIKNKEYFLAKQLLDEYIYLYSSDTQFLALNNFLNSQNQQHLVEYNGDIELLSFAPIVAYPEQAFSSKNSSASNIDNNHITTSEFKKILHSLYENNYVIISPKSVFYTSNGHPYKGKIHLPRNKKPIILILEDVAYSKNLGGVDKLILDNDDNIATYTPKRAINERIGHDNDFITILNNFIAEHPTFSFNDAKALVVVDGHNGIFGYDTAKTNATSKYQIKKATEIINRLENMGYTFASRGYNTSISSPYINFASGINSWQNGPSKIINSDVNIFFLGGQIGPQIADLNSKLDLLNTYRYNLIISNDFNPIFDELSELVHLTAKQVNGNTLREKSVEFKHLFDCEFVYDHLNRPIAFNT